MPVLALLPDFNEEFLKESPFVSYYFVDSWEKASEHSLIETRVIDDAHTFIWLDQPEVVRQAIESFVKNLE